MPTFIIEREIPGASTLTHQELADITAKSNEVVAGLDVPYRWITSYVAGDKIYCVHETDDVATVLEHARGGGFPADLVAEVAAQLGPHFPEHALPPEAYGLVADEIYPVKEGA
ncbi:MAG TPA: DUF4242 domain-containing protein [Nocardioidaceae bacterium]|nr:DUF4242 domain-containing protein [Nocardioidaceae bacterium]